MASCTTLGRAMALAEDSLAGSVLLMERKFIGCRPVCQHGSLKAAFKPSSFHVQGLRGAADQEFKHQARVVGVLDRTGGGGQLFGPLRQSLYAGRA